ncbi:MAG: EAL domain-containing protein [Alphaproteobacteria bacterium]|nr:EAL domain-containing protein [Alphaproteobacteria bacterium]
MCDFNKIIVKQMTLIKHSETKLANHLVHALNHNRLELHAQHQVNIITRKVVGAEVFLRVPEQMAQSTRWPIAIPFNIPRLETEQWIQVASHQGLIDSITKWLVKTIAAFLSDNPEVNTPLSFNAPPSVITTDFVKFIEKIIKTYNISPSMLCIEITEAEKPSDIISLGNVINELRSNGIKVVIDDLGCGYSTMSYLVDLNVDAVKIDKNFIQKAPFHNGAFAVLKSLIDLAKAINLKVICEGIETEHQFEIVKSLGADVAQGYLINRPAPLEKVLIKKNWDQEKYIH